MTIGPDIAEALEEVGIAYTILRDSGNVTGEYLIYEPNAQVTKPFIREFFVECTISYATVLLGGDKLQFNVTEDKYFVMNLTPRMFENEVILYDAVLYKTNEVITIYRPTEVDQPTSYRLRTLWTPIDLSVDVLITTPLFGNSLETDEEIGLLGIENHEMYLPDSVDIEVNDRIVLSTGEKFRVEAIKKRRYSGMNVLDVGEDTRQTVTEGGRTTTTTTSTSSTTTTTTTV